MAVEVDCQTVGSTVGVVRSTVSKSLNCLERSSTVDTSRSTESRSPVNCSSDCSTVAQADQLFRPDLDCSQLRRAVEGADWNSWRDLSLKTWFRDKDSPLSTVDCRLSTVDCQLSTAIVSDVGKRSKKIIPKSDS